MLTKVLLTLTLLCLPAIAAAIDADSIIRNSVAANNGDFKAADQFTYDERDKVQGGTRTYSVTMVEGSPYSRLISVNGAPLPHGRAVQEEQKYQSAVSERKRESPDERRDRINKYEAERRRDAIMMNQLNVAFDFQLTGTGNLDGFAVYKLKATPKPGYHPPNMDSEVLPGMEGRMWIDQKTFHWVRVVARVIQPVSIAGFLAQVEPGTQFEIEKRPVDGDIWQITHYSMHAHAKVLFMFNHNSQDDETYFNFHRIQPGQ